VVATDVVPAAVEVMRANALLNGVSVEVRLGDCYAPVAGERFDLICSNPPQMPTPPDRERADATAAADNGGPDGWRILDRIVAGARDHLRPGGRLVFSIFGFLGRKSAFARLQAQGLVPSLLATEVQSFPRIGYERIEHIRRVDAEATLPVRDLPQTVERLIIQGALTG
jgi:release factor glutamine methyltransferase